VIRLGLLALVAFAWHRGRADAGPAAPTLRDRLAGVRFEEASRELGVDFVHERTEVDPRVANIEPQIVATGAAVSVADVDGNGWPDLYTVTSRPDGRNALYLNDGGHFQDVAERAGLADLNPSGSGACMGSVWADYDNDGDEDVFVYKWGRSQLFENLGDVRFRDVTAEAGLARWCNSNAATWFDYDRDGFVDLLLAGYYHERHDLWDLDTTRIMHDSFEFATNGGRNYLFRNRGDGSFEDVSDRMIGSERRWTYAAASADFDSDGWPDLYVANDYGTEELFLNREGPDGRVLERIDAGLGGESKSGMCVALGDLENRGELSVFVTNISKRGYLFQGNNLRENRMAELGQLVQVARGSVVDCGWAWGAQFGDLNDDGLQDLVVVNGFISAGEQDYWYQMSKLAGANGNLLADTRHWPAFGDRSLSGFERTRVFFNAGPASGGLVEAGEEVGIDDVHDGRAVALADLDQDGDLDVVVANQAGPLLVYRNSTEGERHWIGFDLVGTRSNRSAIGAEVEVEFAGGRQLQVVLAASGFASQNQRPLHFGLGSEPGTVRATVRWPSGTVQRVDDLALDRQHRLEEPQGGS